MKTIYRSKNNSKRNKTIIGVLFLIILGILIVTGLFSNGFYRAMVAFSGGKEGAANIASSFFSIFSSKSTLEKEKDALREKVSEYKIQLADHDFLIQENANLKAAAHLQEDTERINATVISKPPFSPFDILVIKSGKAQGIREGDAVMIGRIYIGVVKEVFEDTSRISLLSAPSNSHEAFVGDEAWPVVLKGKGGGNFETSVPQGSKVVVGDYVITYHNDIPYELGKVSKIIDTEDNTLMTILLTLPINLYSISHVEIIPS